MGGAPGGDSAAKLFLWHLPTAVAEGDGIALPIASEPAHFDGNPDWAPDGFPVCPDSAMTTTANTPAR